MTYNESKMCSSIFCKAFEGKKYGEIVKDCHAEDYNIIISYNFIFCGRTIKLSNNTIWVFHFDRKLIILSNIIKNNDSFETIKEFLEYFKINMCDIV